MRLEVPGTVMCYRFQHLPARAGMTFGLGLSPALVTLTHPAIETKLAYILTGEPVKPLRELVALSCWSQGGSFRP